MIDISNINYNLLAAVYKITANNLQIFSAEGWKSQFRSELLLASDQLQLGFWSDVDLIVISQENYLFAYQAFARSQALILSMKAVEDLSAWKYMGLEWSESYDTHVLKEASSLITKHFERVNKFPYKRDSWIKIINILIDKNRGFNIQSIWGERLYYNAEDQFFYNSKAIKMPWYDIEYMELSLDALTDKELKEIDLEVIIPSYAVHLRTQN
ncbi:hypothetical protein [Alkanindiges illinoisensis]|uniref:hypothetical protein n=1 Tax=Alkanindiges illinoisensis TaxID=197183 RepID=UPI000479E2A3|nr:hypothetical protein [Alkanindiges illinoisensis]